MLRRNFTLRCSTSSSSFSPTKPIPFKWAPELVSFKYANKKYRPCQSLEELCSPKLPPEVIPAFVIPDVITEEESQIVLEYKNRLFTRLPYSDGHYDALISQYKEFYRSEKELRENPLPEMTGHPAKEMVEEVVRSVMARARNIAQQHSPNVPLADRVHFLQLDADGVIKAHADEERNSSSIVAGLCFSSARVMTLTKPRTEVEKERGVVLADHQSQQQKDEQDGFIEMLLQPRSLYILAGTARYDWFHSVDETAAVAGMMPSSDENSGVATYPEPKVGEPIWFAGEPCKESLSFTREMRSVMIWRGVSPRELFQIRTGKRVI